MVAALGVPRRRFASKPLPKEDISMIVASVDGKRFGALTSLWRLSCVNRNVSLGGEQKQ